jgi:nucleotide-binding universal stress UspA family protein
MRKYNKILVAMKLDEEDVSVAKYAASISGMADAEEVHFFHVTEEFDIPDKWCSVVEEDMNCDTMRSKMQELVKKSGADFGKAQILYEASDGDELRDALKYIKEKDIDLVITQKVCGGPKIPERLARKAPCSVIFVPPHVSPTFDNIFVALDFSSYSKEALERAIAFGKAAGAKKITLLHVFAVPIGYYKSGHTYEEFADIMKKNAHEEFEELKNSMDIGGMEINFIIEMNEHPYTAIVDTVHNKGADLLVVGSRGRSKTAAILLGSVTERIIEMCNVPILTVKKKGQGISIIDAMFNI